jgi:hypothetical protein
MPCPLFLLFSVLSVVVIPREARKLSSIFAGPKKKQRTKLFHFCKILHSASRRLLIDVAATRHHNATIPSTADRAGKISANRACLPQGEML